MGSIPENIALHMLIHDVPAKMLTMDSAVPMWLCAHGFVSSFNTRCRKGCDSAKFPTVIMYSHLLGGRVKEIPGTELTGAPDCGLRNHAIHPEYTDLAEDAPLLPFVHWAIAQAGSTPEAFKSRTPQGWWVCDHGLVDTRRPQCGLGCDANTRETVVVWQSGSDTVKKMSRTYDPPLALFRRRTLGTR